MQARSITLLAKIKHNNEVIKCEDMKIEIRELIDKRIDLNSKLKNKRLSSIEKEELKI